MTGTSSESDVGVLGGKVVQLGGSMRGRRELDASGALVLPGGIDMHVHLSLPSPADPGRSSWIDDLGVRTLCEARKPAMTSSPIASASGVSTSAGQIALTRMPESPARLASDRVKLTTPALAAEYTGAAAIGTAR